MLSPLIQRSEYLVPSKTQAPQRAGAMATAVKEAVPEEEVQPAVIEETREKPKTTTDSRSKTKRQPPYAVILHNDNLNGMDHVVAALRKVFHYSRTKAIWLMMKAHVSGRSVVWSGSLEVAELKAEQLKSCGPDPNMKSRGALTLRVTVEALP